jgi:hypothetical protein
MKTMIEEKKKEIEHYEGVLERYGAGRWMDQGRRHLAELKNELKVLEECSQSINGDARAS